ncbi:hypothetical protein BFJ68_g16425 [Fusarium oxysporum]|uniref:AC transposase n=1 Tax=Fusarium oxysporum TaxID=5507 RepID=A0A420PDG7_FUSOX|nr:hypothetical protein BFJ68_g16425 [Fusarium oxysporum]
MAANDTCLYHMYQKLDPSMRTVDIKARRMRCYGHTLNLVARAFLFGKDADSFELESDINSMRGLIEQDLDHWRTKGPIVQANTREQDYEGYRLCEESTAELEVVMNNETRWNSTYMMIERALRKQTDIRAFLFAIQEEENEARRIPADDILSSEDWRVLGEVNEILKPIYLQTMRTQGWGKGDRHGRLWEVLIGMEYLLEHFEDWKVFYSEVAAEIVGETHLDAAERIATAPTNFRERNSRPSRVRRLPARFDEDEVYALPQRSQPTSAVSLPALRRMSDYSSSKVRDQLARGHLVSEEQLAWVRDAKAGIKDYFTRWYDANQGLCEETTKYDAVPRTMGQEDDQYTQWINSKTKKAFATSGSVGELERYLRLEPQGFFSFTEQLYSGCLCYSSDGKRL